MAKGVIASDYAVAAALLRIYDAKGDVFESDLHSFTIDTLSDRLSSTVSPEFDLNRTDKIIKIILAHGIGSFFEDPFADEIFQISDTQISQFFQSRANSKTVFARAWNLGIEWVVTAFKNEKFWEEFDKEGIEVIQFRVAPTHQFDEESVNPDAIRAAREAFAAVVEALDKSNDLGALQDDDVAEIRAELVELQNQLDDPEPDLVSIANRARAALGWIAKEAASAAVGALAIAAYLALLRVFGI